MKYSKNWILGLALMTASPVISATELTVDITPTRSQTDVEALVLESAKKFAKNAAILTRNERTFLSAQGHPLPGPFSFPISVALSRDGTRLGGGNRGRDGGDLVLQFGTGADAFPENYKALLTDVFNAAKPTINAIFGLPSKGGVVLVRNYDNSIGDRDAVAGGIFLANNGSGIQEIRFPIYQDSFGFKNETVAVNFIHTLLLAYMSDKGFASDAYQEGLARAVTMRVVRTAGALPIGLDPVAIESVVQSTYDAGTHYDWWNQRALGAEQFIAPNLRSATLPVGGSVGGIYLLRHQMAGTAWYKVLTEYPSFASTFLALHYANPTADPKAQALSALASLGGSQIEGRGANDWIAHQGILQTANLPGPKLLTQPFAIASGLSGDDFGVFAIQSHFFSTDKQGNETLLSDHGFPVFWSQSFSRFSTSAQEDRIDLTLGYGSIVPNFPSDVADGKQYRVAVDIPVGDRNARTYLPAGSVATVSRPIPNDLYGSVIGLEPGTYSLDVSWPGGSKAGIPVENLAFGSSIPDASFQASGSVFLTLKSGGSPVFSRRVNKSIGPLAVNLIVGEDTVVNTMVAKGLTFAGFGVEPLEGSVPAVLGIPEGLVLAARWNPTGNRYLFYPDCGSFELGAGYFLRMGQNQPLQFAARTFPKTPQFVALDPGWNVVVNPTSSAAMPADVQFVTGADTPTSFASAAGTNVGVDFFEFVPGSPDPVTGAPESGTMQKATLFAPGKPYFVRVLNPNGGGMLFGSTSRLGGDPGVNTRAWRTRIVLSGFGEQAQASFGQARGATANFDNFFDSELPPSADGLQVSIGSRRLSRDVRDYGPIHRFQVKLENLRVGKVYRLSFGPETGSTGKLKVLDPVNGIQKEYNRSGSYSFTARTGSITISVEIPRRS